jgi:hypothetical protein
VETIECPSSNPHSTNGTVEAAHIADEVEPVDDAVVESDENNG